MVTIRSVGRTSPTRTEQERCTSSLMCTEQAPHCATPQPYFVPVRPTCSRITHRSGVSASTSTSRTLPLMLSLAMSFLSRVAFGANLVLAGPARRAGGGLERIENLPQVVGKHSAFGAALPTQVARSRHGAGEERRKRHASRIDRRAHSHAR